MAVKPIIECISRNLVSEHCHSVASSACYTAPLFLVEALNRYSNRSSLNLPFHLHGQEIISIGLMLNIHIV